MAKTDSRCRCLSCGHLNFPPERQEAFRCAQCWTPVQAGKCPRGHDIAWPVFNPQTPCAYCAGKVPAEEEAQRRTLAESTPRTSGRWQGKRTG